MCCTMALAEFIIFSFLHFTQGKTITSLLDEDIVIKWTIDPVPPPYTSLITVKHPSGAELFSALGMSVFPISSDPGNRTSNTGNTNTFTGLIEFTLQGVTTMDAGNYKAVIFLSYGRSIETTGVTVAVYERRLISSSKIASENQPFTFRCVVRKSHVIQSDDVVLQIKLFNDFDFEQFVDNSGFSDFTFQMFPDCIICHRPFNNSNNIPNVTCSCTERETVFSVKQVPKQWNLSLWRCAERMNSGKGYKEYSNKLFLRVADIPVNEDLDALGSTLAYTHNWSIAAGVLGFLLVISLTCMSYLMVKYNAIRKQQKDKNNQKKGGRLSGRETADDQTNVKRVVSTADGFQSRDYQDLQTIHSQNEYSKVPVQHSSTSLANHYVNA